MVAVRELDIGSAQVNGGDVKSPLEDIQPQEYGLAIHIIMRALSPRLGEEPYGKLEMEPASPIGEDARVALVEWITSLPGNQGHEMFIQSVNLAQISGDAATHRALETMYGGPRQSEPTEDLRNWARLFIENIHNSMAVRNRLRLVRQIFSEFLRPRLGNSSDHPIRVLSIAAGSSRGIMETLAVTNGEAQNRVKLRMVDWSENALSDGRALVDSLGIQESVEFIKAHYRAFDRYLEPGYNPDFVEIVGLCDYLPDERIVELLRAVKEHLAEGGAVVFSNIAPNDEQKFTHEIVGWPKMIYREKEDLVNLATQAGFKDSNLQVVSDPLKIYNLVIASVAKQSDDLPDGKAGIATPPPTAGLAMTESSQNREPLL